MKTVITLLFVFLCSAFAISQTVSEVLPDSVQPPRISVKWSPAHLGYYFPSAQFAFEHQVFKMVSMQYDLGAIIDVDRSDEDDYQHMRGFRGSVEVRYYIPSPKKIPFYIAADFYYHNITFNRSQVVGYGCNSGDCDYFEYKTFKVKDIERGPGIKYGILLYPGWNRNRSFFFDISMGFAFRQIRYDFSNRPSGAGVELYSNEDTINLEDPYDYFEPNENSRDQMRFMVGLRMGYRFF